MRKFTVCEPWWWGALASCCCYWGWKHVWRSIRRRAHARGEVNVINHPPHARTRHLIFKTPPAKKVLGRKTTARTEHVFDKNIKFASLWQAESAPQQVGGHRLQLAPVCLASVRAQSPSWRSRQTIFASNNGSVRVRGRSGAVRRGRGGVKWQVAYLEVWHRRRRLSFDLDGSHRGQSGQEARGHLLLEARFKHDSTGEAQRLASPLCYFQQLTSVTVEPRPNAAEERRARPRWQIADSYAQRACELRARGLESRPR